MTKENDGKKEAEPGSADIKRHPVDQGGHAGMHGHDGQQSGGMGGAHGGDLHDAGSGQSDMTGGSGMGGNAQSGRQSGQGGEQQAGEESLQGEGNASDDAFAEVQQSVPREGMGNHRHSNRGNEQALDADADVDDLGKHSGAAGSSRDDKLG